MLAKTILGFAALAASVSAILVSSPAKNAKVDLSEDTTIEWTSVNTDPATFTLQLVDQNNVEEPITISKGVKSSDNKYTVKGRDVPAGSAYKFNFISEDPKNTGILAQSQTFEVIEAEKEETTTSSTAASSTTTSASPSGTSTGEESAATTGTGSSTTFKTANPSKTSNPSAQTSGSAANASGTGSSAAATNTPNAAAALDKTFALGGGLLAALAMLL